MRRRRASATARGQAAALLRRRPLPGRQVGIDRKVRNAERAHVVRHDADIAAHGGRIGHVADDLAVHDEPGCARQLDHLDAVRAIQLGQVGNRGDIATVLAFKTEQDGVLVGGDLDQAQALLRGIAQCHANGRLRILRIDDHVHIGHAPLFRSRSDWKVKRLFTAGRRRVAQREPAILHGGGPALEHLLPDDACQGSQLLFKRSVCR
ncbi:hypothetical protein D3C72_1601330 [compost metagenome]